MSNKPKLSGTVGNMQRRTQRKGWLFILPATILIALMSFYPMISALITSFKTGKGNTYTFNGFETVTELFMSKGNFLESLRALFSNYISLLTSDNLFRTALTNTCIYFIQVPIMLVLALILAQLLNDKQLKLKGLYRTLIFLPCSTSLVACAIIFKRLFSSGEAGLINNLLLRFNLVDEPCSFLTKTGPARVIIIITMLWRWTGYNMIFYLAGLQNIDGSIYESARIDGAGVVKQFTRITVPLLKPVILMTTILSTNGTLQLFDEVKNMTDGGPGNTTMTLSTYIYNITFGGTSRFGLASAISYTILIIVAFLSFIQLKVGDRQ